jgi:hypothetical protein
MVLRRINSKETWIGELLDWLLKIEVWSWIKISLSREISCKVWQWREKVSQVVLRKKRNLISLQYQ